jgi:phage terminase small subunit
MGKEKKRKLTNKEKVFIDEYLKCFSGAEAARKAGYSARSIYSIAYENLRKPVIREELDRRMAEVHMSSAEVLARLSDHARGSHRPFVKVATDGFVYFDFSNPEAMEHLHLVKKIETKRTRRLEGRGKDAEEWEDEWIRVELHDPQDALEMLGKYHKLFVERKEYSGPNGGPIPIFDMDTWKKERESRLKKLKDQEE